MKRSKIHQQLTLTNHENNHFSVQQNSVSKQLDIEYYNTGFDFTKNEILNTKGQVLKTMMPSQQQSGKQKLSLNVSDLINSIYFARLTTPTNVQTLKFIVTL